MADEPVEPKPVILGRQPDEPEVPVDEEAPAPAKSRATRKS